MAVRMSYKIALKHMSHRMNVKLGYIEPFVREWECLYTDRNADDINWAVVEDHLEKSWKPRNLELHVKFSVDLCENSNANI
jgi:hypothetical protein